MHRHFLAATLLCVAVSTSLSAQTVSAGISTASALPDSAAPGPLSANALLSLSQTWASGSQLGVWTSIPFASADPRGLGVFGVAQHAQPLGSLSASMRASGSGYGYLYSEAGAYLVTTNSLSAVLGSSVGPGLWIEGLLEVGMDARSDGAGGALLPLWFQALGARSTASLSSNASADVQYKALRFGSASYHYGEASLSWHPSWLQIDLGVNQWGGAGEVMRGFEGRLRAPLGDRLALVASRTYSQGSPFEGQFDYSSWQLTAEMRVGGAGPAAVVRPAPIPVGAFPRSGMTVFFVPMKDSPDAPRLAGDFSDWEPLLMKKVEGGWALEMFLEPGAYHYSFQTSSGAWFLPSSVTPRLDDGWGNEVSLYVVSSPETR